MSAFVRGPTGFSRGSVRLLRMGWTACCVTKLLRNPKAHGPPLNAVFDSYPLLCVKDLIEQLEEHPVYINAGPHQGLLVGGSDTGSSAEDAFSTASGYLQYQVLPLSLHGAPATFQKLIDVILHLTVNMPPLIWAPS